MTPEELNIKTQLFLGFRRFLAVPCLAAKLISFFLPARITFRGPIRNQSTHPVTSGVSPLTGKSWKTSRNSTTKQAGFRAWGENPKENGIPPVFQLIISWAVLGRCLCSICAEDSQKKEASNDQQQDFPEGLKNQKHYESTTRLVLCQTVKALQFNGAKKSPTCNWGVSSRVTPWLTCNLVMDSTHELDSSRVYKVGFSTKQVMRNYGSWALQVTSLRNHPANVHCEVSPTQKCEKPQSLVTRLPWNEYLVLHRSKTLAYHPEMGQNITSQRYVHAVQYTFHDKICLDVAFLRKPP